MADAIDIVRASIDAWRPCDDAMAGDRHREWIYWDTGNLLRQFGVLPSPTASVTAAC